MNKIIFICLFFFSLNAGQEITIKSNSPFEGGKGDVLNAEQEISVKSNSPFEGGKGDVLVKKNIAYGNALNDKNVNQTLLMDIYRTDDLPEKKKPAIIFVHGGGFSGGDKQQSMYIKMCREFAKAGYVSFSVNYRLSSHGKITFPILENARCDALAAFRWILAHSDEYGIDPSKMLIAGDSAGGGIVVNTAYSDEGRSMIAGCINLWGGLPFSQSEPEADRYGYPVNYYPFGPAPRLLAFSTARAMISYRFQQA